MKFSKYLVLIAPILQLFLYEVLLWQPKLFYYIFFITIFSILACLLILIKESDFSKKGYIYFPLPIFFSAGILIYLTIAGNFLSQILVFINFLFTYFIFKNIFYLFFGLKKDIQMKNILSYGNLLAVFFFSAGFFGIKYFLSLPIWLLVALNLPIMVIIIWSVLGVNKVERGDTGMFVLIGGLVLTEILWTISFLPFNHNTLGLIFTICYYVYIGIVRFFLSSKGNMRTRTIKIYLAFGFASLIIIILSSRA